jgi:hypothetical protein
MKPYVTQADPYLYGHMLNPELPVVPTIPMQQEQYEMALANPNLMFLYSQGQAPPRQPLPPPNFLPNTYAPPPPARLPMPRAKNVRYQGTKPHDPNPPGSIWENFDMP